MNLRGRIAAKNLQRVIELVVNLGNRKDHQLRSYQSPGFRLDRAS
jgi:hypothetical protein